MTKFVIIRGDVGGVHLAPRGAWRDQPRHAREGSDFAPVLFARATPVPAGNAGLVRLQCAVGQGGGNDGPGG